MRTLLRLAVVTLLCVACGGGSSDTVAPPTTTPPPPPAPLVPSSVTVTAGDGQQADPGADLPIRPVVTVKDAAGVVVPGVSVSFAIDSGNGSVQATSATTAADGSASPGNWRLGTTETRNVLRATVNALPPAKLVATARIASAIVATQIVPPGGGTIAITTGVLAGTRLAIPSGAFGVAANWRFDQQSSASWPKRSGLSFVGAALRISGEARGTASKPMRLTLPATAVPGSKLFVVVRNPATGGYEIQPTFSDTAGTVTAMFSHFDGRTFGLSAAAGGAALRQQQAPTLDELLLPSNYDVYVSVGAVPIAELDKDVDTGFRPGLDDWDFRPVETALSKETAFGNVINAMAYFGTKPRPGRLYRKYLEAPGAEFSNRVGLQWSAMTASLEISSRFDVAVSAVVSTIRPNLVDQAFYDALKVNLLVTGLPQLLAAIVPPSGQVLSGGYVPLIAYQVVGGSIKVADPSYPGQTTRAVSFSNGSFALAPVGVFGLPDVVPTRYVFAAMGNIIKMGGIAAATLTEIENRTPMAGVGFPPITVKARTGFVEDSIVYLTDTTRLWVECPACVFSLPSTLGITGKVQPFVLYSGTTGTWVSASVGASEGIKISLTEPTDARVGLLVGQPRGGTSVEIWTDWVWLRLKKWVLDVTAPPSTVGVPSNLAVAVRGPALPGHRFVWEVETGNGPVSITTTGTSPAVVTFGKAGVQPYTVTLQRTADQRALARASGTVEVKEIKQAWRLTSLTKVAEVGNVNPNDPFAFWAGFPDPGEYAGQYTRNRTLMTTLLATPNLGVLYRYAGPSNVAYGVRQFAVGTDPVLTTAPQIVLVSSCGGSVTCTTYNGLTVTGGNDGGSIEGLHIHSRFSALKDKDGLTLTGTFRVGEGHLPPLPYPVHYVDYSFTAVRVP